MTPPEDPLLPIGHRFAEPWHAQVLATAQALIRAGQITPETWAEALGQSLRDAELTGAPDTENSYYAAALAALERVVPVSTEDLAKRKVDWETAFRRTPHGKPVRLSTKI